MLRAALALLLLAFGVAATPVDAEAPALAPSPPDFPSVEDPFPSDGGLGERPADGGLLLHAERMVEQLDGGRLELSGDVRVERDGLFLRADRALHEPSSRRTSVAGSVVFREGLLIGAADAGALEGEALLLEQASLFQKRPTSHPDLEGAFEDGGAALEATGRNALSLHAERIHREGRERLHAEELVLTPCDCRKDGCPDTPSWSLSASSADVVPGDSATLWGGALRIRDVPVLPLPWLMVPLSTRRTGFLLPKPNFTQLSGFQVEEPFFWAINGWSDATITPGWFFGADNRAADPRDPGLRGPRLETEFRYTPSETTHGRFVLGLVRDLKPLPDGSGPRGLRGQLGGTHEQALPYGFADRVDLSLLSDALYFRDVTVDVVAAQANAFRSEARLDHHTATTAVWLSGRYLQTVSPVGPLQDGRVQSFLGSRNANALTFQRIPSLAASWQPEPLGPLVAQLGAEGVRSSTLSARPDVLCPLGDTGCAFLQGRTPATRGSLTAGVEAPVSLGRFAVLSPWLRTRLDGWQLPAGESRGRFATAVGGVVRTELHRVFEVDGTTRLRHVLAPQLELRGLPLVAGDPGGPATPNDEVDAVLVRRPLEAVASLRMRLDRRAGEAFSTPVRLEVGQGLRLFPRELGDAFAQLNVTEGPFSLGLGVRRDLERERWALLQAGASLQPAPTCRVSVGYARLDPSGTDPMRLGLWGLVGPVAPATTLTAVTDRADASVHLGPFAGWGLDGQVVALPRLTGKPWSERWQSLALAGGYTSPCDCWSAKAGVVYQLLGRPPSTPWWKPTSVTVLVDVQRFAGLGGP